MKFTLSWLKEHLDTQASALEIAEALTSLGLELDDFEDPSETFAAFKVAYIEAAERHPDADRLQICTVKTIDGVQKVVCGAPNAREGLKVIFAPEGSYIPGSDMVLKKGVIRGVESCGMLVSEAEMGTSDEHDGIIEVDNEFEIGVPFANAFGLDDPIFTIDLTPNRVDCAGVRGIARDLAAKGLGTLKPLERAQIKSDSQSDIAVNIDDTQGCPLFVGCTIKGVKNGPSPEWLQQKLKAVGLRPISALVDITNFFTIGLCRPLHVYDAQKLKGNITVQTTRGDEGDFEALNDKTYKIAEGAVGIFDDEKFLGLGGIVGGVSSGCDEETTDVFLECAYFDPMRIARTGRDLGIDSDARYRNERGIDPKFTIEAAHMAAQMIVDICGGQASEIVQAGSVPPCEKEISFDPVFVNNLIGMDIEETRQIEILDALGFESEKSGDIYSVRAPSWRPDVWAVDTDGRADLAEEICRVVGLDDLPSVSVCSPESVSENAETSTLSRSRQARNAMAARGLNECITWSFTSKDIARNFVESINEGLSLSNPISSELDQMRPSILPNLIQAAAQNDNRGHTDAALCEVGPVFETSKADGQNIVATGLRFGKYLGRSWNAGESNRAVDTYDAKADALAVLEACGAPAASAQIRKDASSYFHPGRSGTINLGKNKLAQFGELHPLVLEELGVKSGSVVGFEVFLENIPQPKKKGGTEKPYLQLNPLQPLSRDFAFIVDEKTPSEDLIRAAKTADKKLITDAYIFDVYAGQGVEEGKKSLALNITIQPADKTLTDEEIEGIMNAVIENVAIKAGGSLRQ